MGQVDAGSVVINLRANLTQFKSGMTEGSATATRATRQLADTVKGQMGEARGSMMLLSEQVGVHIPRHLQGSQKLLILLKITPRGCTFDDSHHFSSGTP